MIIEAEDRSSIERLILRMNALGWEDREWDVETVIKWVQTIATVRMRVTISSRVPRSYYISGGHESDPSSISVDTFIQDYMEYNSY